MLVSITVGRRETTTLVSISELTTKGTHENENCVLEGSDKNKLMKSTTKISGESKYENDGDGKSYLADNS